MTKKEYDLIHEFIKATFDVVTARSSKDNDDTFKITCDDFQKLDTRIRMLVNDKDTTSRVDQLEDDMQHVLECLNLTTSKRSN